MTDGNAKLLSVVADKHEDILLLPLCLSAHLKTERCALPSTITHSQQRVLDILLIVRSELRWNEGAAITQLLSVKVHARDHCRFSWKNMLQR